MDVAGMAVEAVVVEAGMAVEAVVVEAVMVVEALVVEAVMVEVVLADITLIGDLEMVEDSDEEAFIVGFLEDMSI